MPSSSSPPRPRPAWLEPRFLLGAGLVLASVLGVVALLTVTDRTVPVYAARHALAAGDELDSGDLVSIRARLGEASSAYLAAAPRPHTVVTRSVAKGELVPLGALGSAAGLRQTSVVVAVDGELSSAIDAGARADVWAAEATTQAGPGPKYAEPEVLVAGATVVRVLRDEGLGASGGTSVELRVPKDAASQVLGAVANSAAVTVLPAGG